MDRHNIDPVVSGMSDGAQGQSINVWEGGASFANVNFMRAEHCGYKFYESWALQM